jgi:hypothetical protein
LPAVSFENRRAWWNAPARIPLGDANIVRDIDERIPDLSDKELEQLHANAARLAQSGTKIQQERAQRALPLVDAEIETRRAAQTAAVDEKRREAAARKAGASKKVLKKTAEIQ